MRWFLAVTFVFLLIPRASPAFQIISSAGVSASVQKPTGSNGDDSEFNTSTSRGAIVSSVAAAAIDFDADPIFLPTQWSAASNVIASTTSLGVATSVTLTEYDPSLIGSSLDTSSFASLSDLLDLAGPGVVFISLTYDVSGDQAATPEVSSSMSMTMNFFSNTAGVTLDLELYRAEAPADGSPIPLNGQITTPAFAVTPGDFVDYSVRMTAQTTVNLAALSAGDHAASVDFDQTAIFLGFTVWEDAAMTLPVVSGVTITSSDDAFVYPILPPPTAVPTLTVWPLVVLAVVVIGCGLIALSPRIFTRTAHQCP